jgi:Protein of unknown function (DUF2541)
MTTSKLTRIVGALLLALSIGQAAFAKEAKRWVYLGQTTVHGQRDHDRIGIGRNEGRFNSIQLRVAGAPVEFQRVVVHYTNGSSDEVELRDRIPAGGQTRAIDLRGNTRAISSVEFRFSKANWRTSALPRVSLYGMKFNPKPGPWVYLGQTTVHGQSDHDRIGIGRSEGRFNSIQLRVAGAPVEFQRVVVHYSNGSSEAVEFRDRIPAGGQTRAIDLRGDERAISSVDFHFSKANGWTRSQPRVSLYAR